MMCKIASKVLPKARGCIPGLLVLSVGVCVMPFFVSEAAAQSTRELNSRIGRLEKEIDTLSRALFRGEKPSSGALGAGSVGGAGSQANTEIRLQQMEQELSAVRGQVEEQGYAVRQLREELQRVTSDMALRIEDLEKGRGGAIQGRNDGGGLKYTTRSPAVNNGAGAQVPLLQQQRPQVQTQPQPQIKPQGEQFQWKSGQAGNGNLGSYTQSPSNGAVTGGGDLAAATYENAFSLLKGNQYEAAQKDFEIFLQQYPSHALAGNAKYWLGETHYVRGDFDNSARIFAEGYQQYPTGTKAADNLLKLGMSLSALGKKGDACIALKQVGKEDFKGAGPVLRRAEQEKARLGC